MWFAGAVVVYSILGGILFVSGIWSSPELDACYDQQYDKQLEVDRLTETLSEARQRGDTTTAASIEPTLSRVSTEMSQIDARCLELENEFFGY